MNSSKIRNNVSNRIFQLFQITLLTQAQFDPATVLGHSYSGHCARPFCFELLQIFIPGKTSVAAASRSAL